MLLEAKEEIHKSRSEYEREVKERRAEVSKQERRLQQKEEALDKKIDLHEKKEDELAKRIAAIDKKQEEVESLKRSQMEVLEKISGLTQEEAKAYILKGVEEKCPPRDRDEDQGDRGADEGGGRPDRPRDHRHRHPALRGRPCRRDHRLRRSAAQR